MSTKEENIQELTFLVKELDMHINLLNTKKLEAEQQVNALVKDLDASKAKRREIADKLQHIETSNYFMWENIGDGG